MATTAIRAATLPFRAAAKAAKAGARGVGRAARRAGRSASRAGRAARKTVSRARSRAGRSVSRARSKVTAGRRTAARRFSRRSTRSKMGRRKSKRKSSTRQSRDRARGEKKEQRKSNKAQEDRVRTRYRERMKRQRGEKKEQSKINKAREERVRARGRDRMKRQRGEKRYEKLQRSTERASQRQTKKRESSEREGRSTDRSGSESRSRSRSRSRSQDRDQSRSRSRSRDGDRSQSRERDESSDYSEGEQRYRDKQERTRRNYRRGRYGLDYPIRRGGLFPQPYVAGYGVPPPYGGAPPSYGGVPPPYGGASPPYGGDAGVYVSGDDLQRGGGAYVAEGAYAQPSQYGIVSPPYGVSQDPAGQFQVGAPGSSMDPPPPEEEDEEDVVREEKTPAPFSGPELNSLAVHNVIPYRTVRSLVAIEGPHLLSFVEASNRFLAERDPDMQLSKGLTLMRLAKHLDEHYNTHALGWVSIVRNRPRGWSTLHAAKYADSIDVATMASIAQMKSDEVKEYLVKNPTSAGTLGPDEDFYDDEDDTMPIACKMGSPAKAGDAGVRADDAVSPVTDRFCIFYRRQRKALIFHLNGLIEGISYINQADSRRTSTAEIISVMDVPFIKRTATETRCQHLRLFTQARLLGPLANLMPLGRETVYNVIQGSRLTPAARPLSSSSSSSSSDTDAQFSFSNGFEDNAVVRPLVKLELSTEQLKSRGIGSSELELYNKTARMVAALVTEHQKTIDSLFPGSRLSNAVRL